MDSGFVACVEIFDLLLAHLSLCDHCSHQIHFAEVLVLLFQSPASCGPLLDDRLSSVIPRTFAAAPKQSTYFVGDHALQGLWISSLAASVFHFLRQHAPVLPETCVHSMKMICPVAYASRVQATSQVGCGGCDSSRATGGALLESVTNVWRWWRRKLRNMMRWSAIVSLECGIHPCRLVSVCVLWRSFRSCPEVGR